MIECDICEDYYEDEDLYACPNHNCSHDFICQSCYGKHIATCMSGEISI